MISFDTFINHIPYIKSVTVEARDSHKKMAPKEREPFIDTKKQLHNNPKESAVLALFYPKKDNTHLVLIERSRYPGVHSSQISFPGGQRDDGDIDLEDTALRETAEEIGIYADKIEIIKQLSDIYVPPSNFMITPFCGFSREELSFSPAPDEVAKIIEMPLEFLLNPDSVTKATMNTIYANTIEVPAYKYDNNIIWGATAMMLSEIKDTIIESHIY